MIYGIPVVALLVSATLIAIILHSKAGKRMQDIPNARSLHSVAVPRSGGVGLMAGILSAWLLMLNDMVWWVILPMLFLFSVSFIDDLRGLAVGKRLLAHFGAAALLVLGSGLLQQQGVMVALLVLLAAVWMTNLYNFMDGSDGLAGGMALIGFSIYGIAAWTGHNETKALLNFAIAGAAAGFLWFNFHPARIFMGDAASIPLGFLVAAMGLWGWQDRLWPMWFPVLVFSPFIVDASVTLIKRSLHGKKITEAHRDHYYQHMVRMGVGHRNTALIEYALMLCAGSSALWALKNTGGLSMVATIWVLAYAAAMLWLKQAGKTRADE